MDDRTPGRRAPRGSTSPRATSPVATALACLLLAAACDGGGSPGPSPSGAPPSPAGPALASLRVQQAAAEDGATPADCPVAAGTGLALLAGLDLPPGARPALSVLAGCQSGDAPGGLETSALVALDVTTAGQPDQSFEGVGRSRCESCAGPKGTGAALAVAGAVRAALDLALGQARVARLPDGDLAALLADPRDSPRSVLLAALEEAGIRRLAAALAPAVEMLGWADDEVALRAVGVLGRLEDPAAARALGRAALTKRPEVPFAALRALADMEGPEARRALELAAGQSTDPVVAREAVELLREQDGAGRE